MAGSQVEADQLPMSSDMCISATHANHNRPWQSCSWRRHWNTNIHKGYHIYWAMG